MQASDAFVLPIALWSAYALRLSEWWPEQYLSVSVWLFLATPIMGIFIFSHLGLYRAVVRFMESQAIWAVAKGVSLLALTLWAIVFVFQIQPFPRSIPINFALVSLVYVGGSRLLIRHYYHWFLRHKLDKDAVLIYGAGGAGVQLATALSDGKEYYPVGFIDDDPSLWKSTIKNLPVYNIEELHHITERDNIKHILLALPNTTNKQRTKILEHLSQYNIHTQTIPSMPDLLSGKASVEQLREIDIEDLLGRDAVPPAPNLLRKCITNKTVLITGAGGSIGSELCRQVLEQEPKILILLEQSEFNLYQIEQELSGQKSEGTLITEISALLGSVNDRGYIRNVFKRFSIDTIYHAAAYKHVPLVEKNIIEGVNNNILGTKVVAEEASSANIPHFILISTDKAVRPTNVMGATKRFSELILQAMSQQSNTIFSMVRFGNVLGSSGSVVPLFRTQIAKGGPITVTHKDITRFFMTIPEAASLVIQASSIAEGGDVFLLDMGDPVKIVDLAKRMVQLSGLELKDEDHPEGDIEIQYTGLRPAEKLYEELLLSHDIIGTQHGKIMRANEAYIPLDEILLHLEKMQAACATHDIITVKSILTKVVSGYQPYNDKDNKVTKDKNNNIVKFR